MKKCKYCNKILTKRQNQNTFCSVQCSIDYKFEKRSKEIEQVGYFYDDNRYNARDFCKKYLLKKQNNRCSICNIENNWNNKNLVFIADHINGIANDWSINNLRLVCPNCDSQLPTYKSKNKNSVRPR